MLCKKHWQTDVGQTELRESSDLSVTSGGLQLGLLLCAPWGTAGHTSPGVRTSRDRCLELHAFTKPSRAEEFQALLEFSFVLDFFFPLKNICCWFSLVLKSCRVEMLTCFHLSVPLTQSFLQSFLFFSVLVPPAVCLSERCTHRPGWGPDLIPMLFICQADVY